MVNILTLSTYFNAFRQQKRVLPRVQSRLNTLKYVEIALKYIKHVETNRTGTAVPVFQRISTQISTSFSVFHVFQCILPQFLERLEIRLNWTKYVKIR